jgi:hypothetical protein
MSRTRTASWRTRVLVAVVGACLGLGITGIGAAFGYWVTTDPLNPAQAVATSLPQGATPTASVSSTSYDTVIITFAEANTTTDDVEIPASDYVLQRYPSPGGPPVAVTASCAGTGTITCTDSSVPDGTWQYTDTPTYAANWVGTESAMSAPVTVNTTPTVSVTYPVDGTAYGSDWNPMITGTASAGGGATIASTAVAIEDTTTDQWWSGSSFSASTQTFVGVTGTTTWMLTLEASNLTSGDSYSVVAQATDSAGNVANSSTVTFTYKTAPPAPPTVSITYPVDNTAYGAAWTGTITGTASSGAGATINATEVAIEDTTTNQWWSGSSFSASSQMFVQVSGTTTWYLAFGASNLTSGDNYSLIAQATDSAENLGTSSTVTFTCNITPAVSITYPVDGTTYGADWTGTITGTASPGTGATITSTGVAIEDTSTTMWWSGKAFAATSQTFVGVSGTTTWLLPLGTGNLTSGDSYSLVAEATDSAGNLGTSPTVSFTYGTTATATTPPTVAITYPVDGTVYGSDWTGTITGTASPNSGPGSTITSTAVAIEDTTTNQWWSGSSFNDATQTFVPVSGTTTWMLGLEADNLTSGDSYSVIAQATDSAGNVGTSSTVSFTYGTTMTTSTTTTTTPPTTSTTTTTTPPTTSTTTTTTPPTTSTTTTSLASA